MIFVATHFKQVPKGTMDPEGACLPTYSTIGLQQAPPVHKYSSVCSTAHCAAAGVAPHIVLQPMIEAARLVKVECQVLNR